VTWTTLADVAAALGPSVPFADDPGAQDIVDAANAAAFRKRREAGYTDDPDTSPGPDVAYGTTLWAVALYRERASTDSYVSFDALGTFQPTGGTWATIRRMLGVGRAQVDTPAQDLVTTPLRFYRPYGVRRP